MVSAMMKSEAGQRRKMGMLCCLVCNHGDCFSEKNQDLNKELKTRELAGERAFHTEERASAKALRQDRLWKWRGARGGASVRGEGREVAVSSPWIAFKAVAVTGFY